MIITYIPLLVCIVGLLMFALSENPKIGPIGKDMFWVGLLVTLASASSHVVTLGR